MKTSAGGQVEEITDSPCRKVQKFEKSCFLFHPLSLSLPPLCEDIVSVAVGENYAVSLKL